MLPDLHRPDRHVATLTTRHTGTFTLLFTFNSKFFLSEIFNALPNRNTDTSQLELALIHDESYFELPKREQEMIDQSAKPLSNKAFLTLIDALIDLLHQEQSCRPEDQLRFRTPPDAHNEVLLKARDYIKKTRETLYLVIEWKG